MRKNQNQGQKKEEEIQIEMDEKNENVLGGSKSGMRSRYLKLGCLVLWLPLLVSFAERTLLQGVLRIEAFISLFVSNH